MSGWPGWSGEWVSAPRIASRAAVVPKRKVSLAGSGGVPKSMY